MKGVWCGRYEDGVTVLHYWNLTEMTAACGERPADGPVPMQFPDEKRECVECRRACNEEVLTT